jgi:hypothetical protein
LSFIVISRRRSFGEISAIYQLLSKQLINRANRSSNHRATLQVARCLLSLLSDNELIYQTLPFTSPLSGLCLPGTRQVRLYITKRYANLPGVMMSRTPLTRLPP